MVHHNCTLLSLLGMAGGELGFVHRCKGTGGPLVFDCGSPSLPR